jgi:hypothetical protein
MTITSNSVPGRNPVHSDEYFKDCTEETLKEYREHGATSGMVFVRCTAGPKQWLEVRRYIWSPTYTGPAYTMVEKGGKKIKRIKAPILRTSESKALLISDLLNELFDEGTLSPVQGGDDGGQGS